MAKRGRKKKFKVDFNISPEAIRSIFAIALILFSGIVLVSFLFPNYPVNSTLQLVLRKSFGIASILIPIVTAIIGLFFIESFKHEIKELRVIVGLILFIITIAGFSHLFISSDIAKIQALDGKGGGFIGYILAYSLKSTISVYGAFLFLFALAVVSIILTFNISLDLLIDTYVDKIKGKSIFGAIFSKKHAGNLEITPGMDAIEDSKDDYEGNSPDENYIQQHRINVKEVEPTFEIIPTISEPLGDQMEGQIRVMKAAPSISSPNLPYSDKVWKLPSYDLLNDEIIAPPDTGNIEDNKKIIKETLNSFGIPIDIENVQVGPSVTKYELRTPSGTRVAKIANLQFDLALALASSTGSVRIEAPIPGKALVGIEVPNKTRSHVNFKSLISSDTMKGIKSKLAVVLGKDVGGLTHIYDIAKMPHILIAGATNSGKSIFIHNLIFSILYRATPQEVKFIMVDPKRVELTAYQDIPHLYTPLVTDTEKAPAVFNWAVSEMSRRYKLFEAAKARNIDTYNDNSGFQALPYIVIIVDEFTEIMMADPSAVEKSIIRIAQLARATGIHLVLAAQRPQADVITGLIKANIPCRVAFNVTSQIDSRVIIDQPGAEKLLGKGDMLFLPPDKPNPLRLQGAMVTDKEISDLVKFLKDQGVAPEYKSEILEMPRSDSRDRGGSGDGGSDDPQYEEAKDTVVNAGKASASLLQRRLSIGYARAARLLDTLEENGVIGPANGSKPRDVLLDTTPYPDDIEEKKFIRHPPSPLED